MRSPLEDAKAANPASWITPEALESQRQALPEAAFRRWHCGQWLASESAVFSPGAWQACARETSFQDGETIVVAVDASGGCSDAAVCWVNEAGHVGVEIIEGDGSAHQIDQIVGELAETYAIREVCADPWHVQGYLTEKWEQRGLVVSEFPQTDSRVVPATEQLVRAVQEGRITHPDSPALKGSMLRDTRRGPRLDKRPGRNNDGLVALVMAWDRLEHRPEPVRLLGWLP